MGHIQDFGWWRYKGRLTHHVFALPSGKCRTTCSTTWPWNFPVGPVDRWVIAEAGTELCTLCARGSRYVVTLLR